MIQSNLIPPIMMVKHARPPCPIILMFTVKMYSNPDEFDLIQTASLILKVY